MINHQLSDGIIGYHRAPYFQTHPYVTGTSKSPASDLLRPSFRPWACQRRPSAWRPSAEQKRGSGQFGFTDIFFSIDLFGYLLKNMTKNPPKSLGFWSRQWNSRENAQVLWLRTTYCKYRSHGNVNEKMYSAFTHLDISKQETYETLFNGSLVSSHPARISDHQDHRPISWMDHTTNGETTNNPCRSM